MNVLKKLAAVTVAAALLTGVASQAQAMKIWVKNDTKNALWITVYLYNGHNGKEGYYCVLPGDTREDYRWKYGNQGGGVYVRAEVKESDTSCGNHKNIGDVTTGYMTVSESDRSMAIFSSSWKGNRSPGIDTSRYH
ncbi:hypothetical protein [uncultured Methylobacterium sp.]|uniref:hypothetical protein n=1 Tax=uncultured Methylobacterium sp. TaxID=157278 RepID=UPI0035CB6B97